MLKNMICAHCVSVLAEETQHIFGKMYIVAPCSACLVETPRTELLARVSDPSLKELSF